MSSLFCRFGQNSLDWASLSAKLKSYKIGAKVQSRKMKQNAGRADYTASAQICQVFFAGLAQVFYMSVVL